jgi:hypothetical protein
MARCGSLLLILAAPVLLRAGSAEPEAVSLRLGLAEPGWFKISHGYVVAFNRAQKIPSRDSIEVFDREGRRVARVDVLGQLPGAAEVTLDDVSVRETRPIVAGVTIRKADGGLEDMLLYFTWEGLLDRSVSIPPEQEINNIELDENGNVWTLTDYSGRPDDDTTGPLIFVYDHTGHLMKALLRRTDYPAGFKEGPLTGGLVGFGLTQDGLWFWQPARRRMTVVNRDGHVLSQKSVTLPRSQVHKSQSHPPEADLVALLPSGQVAAGIVSPWPDVPTGAYLSRGKHFVRSSSQKLRLIGIDGLDFVFLKQHEPGSIQFEIVREPLPAPVAVLPASMNSIVAMN